MDSRTLVFILFCRFGWDADKILAALKTLAASQFDTAYGSGGKVVTSASIGGENFNLTLPQGFMPDALARLCRTTYNTLKDMDADEMEAWQEENEADSLRISMNINP